MAGEPVTRSRDFFTPLGVGQSWTEIRFDSGFVYRSDVTETQFPTIRGTQFTTSQGHAWASRSTKGQSDIGGPFSTTKSEFKASKGAQNIEHVDYTTDKGGYGKTFYSGPVLPMNPSGTQYAENIQTSDDDLDELGATAIARCKPTNSVADLSTFLGETLHDGFPAVVGARSWKARLFRLRQVGDEFLNVEFGWQPLISDMKKFRDAVLHTQSVLRQYERDAGKVVRRKYHFPIGKDKQSFLVAQNVYPYGPTNGAIQEMFGLGNVRCTVETERTAWFSGAFTYQLPSGYDSRKGLDRVALVANKIFGAKLTPEVLWNLTPWSWAIDWFTNTGDILSNVSSWASDGLVLRYGYIMETTVVSRTYTFEPHGGVNPQARVGSFSLVTTTKVRRQANPFGFGVRWDGLSPIQAAIAAALGLSRHG